MKKWTLYAHKTPNGKYYIGITSSRVTRRWNNGNGYRSSKYFYNAIQKYGWENIEHIIIATDMTREDANWFEEAMIRELNTTNRKLGYNITLGGDGVKGVPCPEHKKERQRISMRGKGNHMYGISLKGRSGEENPMYGKPAYNRKKVECITTGRIFDTVTEGASFYGTFRSDVSKVCKGTREYAGTLNGEKLYWRYYDGEQTDCK